jgi:hypothetical protein
MSIYKKYNIYIYDIDEIFIKTNKSLAQYLINKGLPLTFDFSNKDNQKLFIHYFLCNLCEFVKSNPHNRKMIFYSNVFTKDPFRLKVISKVKQIFGFKIWEGIWTHKEFLKLLDFGKAASIDTFELFIQEESKPKSFKHIKKYLDKEGFTFLGETFFTDLVNKMIICC